MPGIGATDSADLVAQVRAEMGLLRQLQQTRRELLHPRDEGSSGYPVWFHDEQLVKWYAGEATEVSLASLYRWEERRSPHRQTGAPARTAAPSHTLDMATGWPLANAPCWIRSMPLSTWPMVT